MLSGRPSWIHREQARSHRDLRVNPLWELSLLGLAFRDAFRLG